MPRRRSLRSVIGSTIATLGLLWAAGALVGSCKAGGDGSRPAPKDESPPPAMEAEPAGMTGDPMADPAAKPSADFDPALLQGFKPLPPTVDASPGSPEARRIQLGYLLFYETRLSKNHDISCNTCHMLDKFGADHPDEKTSKGHRDLVGTRNSPTVYNSAHQISQFWDGRAKDVEEQAKGPILNAVEMAMPNERRVLETLRSIPGYATAFKEAFPGEREPLTYDNVAKAIGAFERQLQTPSRWDRFLAGDRTALTDAEKNGFVTFVRTGCATCHAGLLVGGHKHDKLGAVKPWPDSKDTGRHSVTKKEEDKHLFKVPMLRNVEKTAPYYHDGSVPTLEQAVKLMGEHQHGRALVSEEITAIVTWLKSLTGELPKRWIVAPKLPPSGPRTPRPDPR